MVKNASYYNVKKKNIGRSTLPGLYTPSQINPKLSRSGPTLAQQVRANTTNSKQASFMRPGKNASYSRQASQTNPNSARDQYDAYLNSLGSGGGGGYASGIDLSNILDTYTQSANAQKKEITDSTASRRQGLLDSLKRFQDETKEARDQQRRAYNASRADLEGQAFMANRQAARSAAARGLGGSVLQQLAQLQAQIGQGEATNKLAQSNTDTLKAINTAAQNKEEDTNKALQALDTETANKLAQIDANTANLQAQLQYNEAVRLEEAKARAAAVAASNASSANSYKLAALKEAAEREELNNAAKTTLGNITKQGLNALQDAYDNAQKSKNTATNKKAREALKTTLDNYSALILNKANDAELDYSAYNDQLNKLYNKLYYRGH